MDELIGFIVEAIFAAMKRSEKRKSPVIPFEEAQRRQALAAQMQALQQQVMAAKRGAPARSNAAPSRAMAKPARGTPRPPPLPGRSAATVAPTASPARADLQPRS